MVDRRNILKITASSVAGGLVNLPGQAFAAALQTHYTKPLLRVIYDERFQESFSFAEQFNREGVLTSLAGRDVSGLWYDDLRAHIVQKGVAPIAGLTDRTTLFCLEELARDVGMKVVFRIDHMIDKKGQVQHTPVEVERLSEMVAKLDDIPNFGPGMATLIKHYAMFERESVAAQKVTGPFSNEEQIALVSWLLT